MISVYVNDEYIEIDDCSSAILSEKNGHYMVDIRRPADGEIRRIKNLIDQTGSAAIHFERDGEKLITLTVLAEKLSYQYVHTTGEEKLYGECLAEWRE
jgi:hypothetical protein